MGVVLSDRSPSMRQLDLAFRDAEDKSIGGAAALTILGANPGDDGMSVTMDQAEKVIGESE